MLDYLQLKRDVRFFNSIAGMMNNCSVMSLDMYERQVREHAFVLLYILQLCNCRSKLKVLAWAPS